MREKDPPNYRDQEIQCCFNCNHSDFDDDTYCQKHDCPINELGICDSYE